jgi:coenzyme F420-dependent glucose-6-phosphate dehydrogenase
MAQIGYQASHEQFAPSELLKYVVMAEKAGFKAINSSDHFHPWSERQGQSGFSFAWLGAAMQTTTIPFGMVCSPGQRYHPAIVAQAAATLGELFPDRFWVALGSGEAINENITGEKWLTKPERNTRLLECAQIIRRLFNGETVSHRGLVTVEKAKLYTRPVIAPPLFCAAMSVETAAWAGSWADGMITAHKPYEEMKQVVDAFRNNGGAGKPVYLKVQLSYAKSHDEAVEGAYEQWRTNIFQGSVLGDMPTVAHFDAAAEFVKPEDLNSMVRISADLEQHIEWLKQDVELGFEKIILHNVNRQQELFIRDFGQYVLPGFNADIQQLADAT